MDKIAGKGIIPIIYGPLKKAVEKGLSFEDAKKEVEADPEVSKAGLSLREEDYKEVSASVQSYKSYVKGMEELSCLADEWDKKGLSAQANKLDRLIQDIASFKRR